MKNVVLLKKRFFLKKLLKKNKKIILYYKNQVYKLIVKKLNILVNRLISSKVSN